MTEFIKLQDIAHARSGDKGNHANIGVIAYTPEGYEFLKHRLSETQVAGFLLPFRPKEVERYELPGIYAFNFLLKEILRGGASQSLKIDNQGKTLALALLEMPLPAPPNLSEMTPPCP